MEAKAIWKSKKEFIGETESGHKVKMDIAIEKGGENTGPPPIQLLLVALGGCTGIDLVSIMEKKRAKLQEIEIKIDAEQAQDYPKVFRKIHLEFLLKGENLKEADIKHAVELSKNKYCSVGAMLEKTAEINYTWKIKKN